MRASYMTIGENSANRFMKVNHTQLKQSASVHEHKRDKRDKRSIVESYRTNSLMGSCHAKASTISVVTL